MNLLTIYSLKYDSLWSQIQVNTVHSNNDYLELYNPQTLIHMYWILAYQVYPVWDLL